MGRTYPDLVVETAYNNIVFFKNRVLINYFIMHIDNSQFSLNEAKRYLSILENCSASGSNQGAIDNRIEQAMDLVKSHLMNAVRSEVEELKEKIVKLEETISNQQTELSRSQNEFNREVGRLQSENEFLRSHVTQEILVQIPQNPQIPQNATPQQQQQPPQQQQQNSQQQQTQPQTQPPQNQQQQPPPQH